MAMDISWIDTLRAAFSSCFPSSSSHPASTSNPDLNALLDSSSDVDALSLHSNYRPHRRSTNKSKGRRITLCGLEAFGRSKQPIALRDDDDSLPSRSRTTSTGSGTYDSDAAPLDASSLTPARLAQLQREEQEAKEERRRARRAKKEQKRLKREREEQARARALLEGALHGSANGAEFEGFQGSGTLPPLPDSPDDFIYVEDAPYRDDEEDDDADLGGAIYSRSPRVAAPGGGSSGQSSSSFSSSRSPRSQSSHSHPSPHSPSFPNHHQQLLPTHAMHLPSPIKKKSKRKGGSRSSATSSTLADSPVAAVFPGK
ncbi:hypothetical protein BDZ89DRAFT_1156291 [Hymenopellis radicata]|nr:hypothetical protein BDZ89DRAFT_1156291 [Hymenopellis radicata]